MSSPRTQCFALVAFLAATSLSFSFALFSAPPSPQLAFTFDDLPAHGPLPPNETRLEVANKILAALHAAQLPPVYGFVNAAILEKEPDDLSVLQAWRDSGNPLGNHTWSHMNLNQNSLEDFESNVTRNEPVLSKLMNNQDWHWFRFPYLAEGDTPAKHDAIRAFLAQHGYRIAAVTMSFSDYLWNEPYARCMAKSDSAAIARLKTTYLSAADANIIYYRQLSRTLYHRDIPYVLLMHIGALDAEMLPQLLDLYRSRGFRFVSLPQAEHDSFYRLDTNPALPSGPTTLEDALRSHNLPVLAPPSPSLDFNSLCRWRRAFRQNVQSPFALPGNNAAPPLTEPPGKLRPVEATLRPEPPSSHQTTNFPPTLSIHSTSPRLIRILPHQYCILTVKESHRIILHVSLAIYAPACR
ncbi:MAG: polysaccharide deacetylase family protein [Candidatus Acidiferrum sp.]